MKMQTALHFLPPALRAGLAALTLAAVVVSVPTVALAQAQAQVYAGPLFDAHMHYNVEAWLA